MGNDRQVEEVGEERVLAADDDGKLVVRPCLEHSAVVQRRFERVVQVLYICYVGNVAACAEGQSGGKERYEFLKNFYVSRLITVIRQKRARKPIQAAK